MASSRRGGQNLRRVVRFAAPRAPSRSPSQQSVSTGLRSRIDSREPDLKVDRLLVCALIEARSSERFTRLLEAVGNSDPEIASLLHDLGPAEMRHWKLFHGLAAREIDPATLAARWGAWLEWERELTRGRNRADRARLGRRYMIEVLRDRRCGSSASRARHRETECPAMMEQRVTTTLHGVPPRRTRDSQGHAALRGRAAHASDRSRGAASPCAQAWSWRCCPRAGDAIASSWKRFRREYGRAFGRGSCRGGERGAAPRTCTGCLRCQLVLQRDPQGSWAKASGSTRWRPGRQREGASVARDLRLHPRSARRRCCSSSGARTMLMAASGRYSKAARAVLSREVIAVGLSEGRSQRVNYCARAADLRSGPACSRRRDPRKARYMNLETMSPSSPERVPCTRPVLLPGEAARAHWESTCARRTGVERDRSCPSALRRARARADSAAAAIHLPAPSSGPRGERARARAPA